MSDLAGFLRDWIHETPLSLCNAGADTCPDWRLANALAEAIQERDTVFAGPALDRLNAITSERIAFVEERRAAAAVPAKRRRRKAA